MNKDQDNLRGLFFMIFVKQIFAIRFLILLNVLLISGTTDACKLARKADSTE